jgi:hypothetical protein
MAAVCWIALAVLMAYYQPDAVARILFLALFFLAASFTSAPLFMAIHRRLARNKREQLQRQAAVWREAGLVGIFCTLCAWLRFSKALNWVNALLLLAVLALTEALLLARE